MDDLLIKYLLGETNPDETARVGQWLSEDDRNRQRYEQFRAVWKISGPTGTAASPDAPAASPDPQAALQRFRQRLQRDSQKNSQIDDHRPARSLLRLPGKWRVAAVIAGLLCAGAGTYISYILLHRPGQAPVTANKKNRAGTNRKSRAAPRSGRRKFGHHSDTGGMEKRSHRQYRQDRHPARQVDSYPQPAYSYCVPAGIEGRRTDHPPGRRGLFYSRS